MGRDMGRRGRSGAAREARGGRQKWTFGGENFGPEWSLLDNYRLLLAFAIVVGALAPLFTMPVLFVRTADVVVAVAGMATVGAIVAVVVAAFLQCKVAVATVASCLRCRLVVYKGMSSCGSET